MGAGSLRSKEIREDLAARRDNACKLDLIVSREGLAIASSRCSIPGDYKVNDPQHLPGMRPYHVFRDREDRRVPARVCRVHRDLIAVARERKQYR